MCSTLIFFPRSPFDFYQNLFMLLIGNSFALSLPTYRGPSVVLHMALLSNYTASDAHITTVDHLQHVSGYLASLTYTVLILGPSTLSRQTRSVESSISFLTARERSREKKKKTPSCEPKNHPVHSTAVSVLPAVCFRPPGACC